MGLSGRAAGAEGGKGPPLFGVDTMLFVYHFEGNDRFGAAAGRLLAAAEAGRCRLVTSILTQLEVLVVPKRHGQAELCRRYRELLDGFPNLTLLPIGKEIAEIAGDLRAAHEIRTPDALHLATAIHAGAGAFLSEDRRLRRIEAVRVVGLEEVAVEGV